MTPETWVRRRAASARYQQKSARQHPHFQSEIRVHRFARLPWLIYLTSSKAGDTKV